MLISQSQAQTNALFYFKHLLFTIYFSAVYNNQIIILKIYAKLRLG